MAETIYNTNWKERGITMKYSRKRNNAFLDPFVALKHIQKTNRVSSSQYTDTKGTHIGSQVIKRHGSYDSYLRKLKSPIIKSKGKKTGLIKGCKCGQDDELTNEVKELDMYYKKEYVLNENVYAIRNSNTYYEKALIQNVGETGYDISFNSDNSIRLNVNVNELEKYFGDCKCGVIKKGKLFISNPNNLSTCSNYNANTKEYFKKMGGYYKNTFCI